MYDMKYPGRRTLKAHFKHGVREFGTYAMSRDVVKREGGIRCPCIKCSCVLIIKSPEDVIDHLENVGFMDDYYVWRHHGEQEPKNTNVGFMVDTHALSSGVRAECENFGHMEDMVGDALGVNLSYERGDEEEIIPNEKALKFYSIIEEVNKPLFEGSSDSKLSMCAKYDDLVLKYIERQPEYSCNADLSEAVQLHLWDLASGPGNDYRRYGYGRLAPNFQHKSLHYIPTGEEQYSHPTTIPPELQKTIETMVQQLESQTVELQRRAQREQELTERLNKEIEDRRQW
ncbi:hypothetical protein TSUD_379440 [Trifolium subterraneum]|uniref:Transposase-associated domain-containing protein n=1 Tax=Trifolium subterraneum TaxID=3900 RepID=A0A2Z6MB31_TRISU|nr:hypothetical protein TSUD_379440 [Trifolium subterraneum]